MVFMVPWDTQRVPRSLQVGCSDLYGRSQNLPDTLAARLTPFFSHTRTTQVASWHLILSESQTTINHWGGLKTGILRTCPAKNGWMPRFSKPSRSSRYSNQCCTAWYSCWLSESPQQLCGSWNPIMESQASGRWISLEGNCDFTGLTNFNLP